MMATEEKVHNGKMTKVERYKWKVQGAPGHQRMVNKNDLQIDHTYQRNANDMKLMAIARDWSWIACGSIVVADREGVLFVVDGQHRVMAARKRSDITELPCLVFKTHEAKQEAKGFLAAQTQRKPITSVEKFRALVTVEDPAAMVVQELLNSTGHAPGNGMSAMSVKCVGVLIKEADTDAATLCKVWPLIAVVSEGKPVHARLIEGLLYIEKRMPEGDSLTDRDWLKRVKKAGVDALLEGAAKASAFYSHGGAKVWAAGMVEAINRGHRNRLELAQ
jgi:hypothetical protein